MRNDTSTSSEDRNASGYISIRLEIDMPIFVHHRTQLGEKNVPGEDEYRRSRIFGMTPLKQHIEQCRWLRQSTYHAEMRLARSTNGHQGIVTSTKVYT